MILSITNLKGGVGKSTIAQNLAVMLARRKYNVCIADTDVEQQTSVKWSSIRSERAGDVPDVPVYLINPDTISDQVLNKLAKMHEIVIIDGTPALTELTTRIIIMSDAVITPILASATDVWALDTFLNRYKEARITKEAMGGKVDLYVVMNKFNEKINIDRDIREAVEAINVKVMTTKLSTRVAYKEAVVQGLGVVELKDKTAAKEIDSFADEIESILKPVVFG